MALKNVLVLLVLPFCVARFTATPPPPSLLPSQAAPSSIFNVKDFGAVGDGITDDTLAFSQALDACGKALGGVVFVPPGQFVINGSLVVPTACTLQGTFSVVPSHPGLRKETPTAGSILFAVFGRGNDSAPALITVSPDSVVRGLVVFYPTQNNASEPVPFPWTFDMQGVNPAITDVECVNCWNAIRAVGAGRHYIARVQGQPLNTGVYIDQTYDIGRVEDVHFNPWWSPNKELMAHQLKFGRSFVIARTDWEYVFNTFSFGYAIGYHFIESEHGACNGNFLGIGADMCANASVQVDAADKWGILITNGEFTAFVSSQFGVELTDSTQVVVSPSNTGSVRFSNSAFWGPSFQIAKLNSAGTVGFSDCTFTNWDVKGEGRPALDVQAGSVVVKGSEFQQKGLQMRLSKSVDRAVFVGNLITGPLKIDDQGAKNFQKGLNADQS